MEISLIWPLLRPRIGPRANVRSPLGDGGAWEEDVDTGDGGMHGYGNGKGSGFGDGYTNGKVNGNGAGMGTGYGNSMGGGMSRT